MDARRLTSSGLHARRHVDERERDPIEALAHAYTLVLHEYSSLLLTAPDEATEDMRKRRADLDRQLDELNGRLEALNHDES